MVRAVVGVDLLGTYVTAIHLFDRLSFKDSEICFVNAVEPVPLDVGMPPTVNPQMTVDVSHELTEAGKRLMEGVSEARSHATTRVEFGFAAQVLIDCAQEFSADLVVAGSQQKSLLETLFTGSVARTLTESYPGSVLIGKAEPESVNGLAVVISHDLSNYSNLAIAKFISFMPAGIKRAILVTADTTHSDLVSLALDRRHAMEGQPEGAVALEAKAQHEALIERLKTIIPEVDTVVSEGSPNDVIRETMIEQGADLLVMGARGHGMLERLFVGSTALHQVMREPHNVLLMRA